MIDLQFDITPIETLEKTARVVVQGAIDASSVVAFESKLKQLQQDGYTHFVLDMAGIKYVNSTGLGSLVSTADNLEKVGGGLALIKVHPKVEVVFDMLGLNSFFKIFESEEKAIQFLSGEEEEEAPEQANAQAPLYSRPQVSQQSPALEPASETRDQPAPARASAGTTPSVSRQQTNTFQALPPTPPVHAGVQKFIPPTPEAPRLITCPHCGAQFKVSQLGRYKCLSCGTPFVVDPTFGVELAPATSQLTLSFTSECKEGLSAFLWTMVLRSGYAENDFHAIQKGLDEAMHFLLYSVYEGNVFESFALAFLPARRNLQMKMIAYGAPIEGDLSQLMPELSRVMTRLEVQPHPRGGSVITLHYKK